MNNEIAFSGCDDAKGLKQNTKTELGYFFELLAFW
jgi:hypothetical protein